MAVPHLQIDDVVVGTQRLPTYHENGSFAGYRPPHPFLSAAPMIWHGVRLWRDMGDSFEADLRHEALWEPVRFWFTQALNPDYAGNSPYDLSEIVPIGRPYAHGHCRTCSQAFVGAYGTKHCSARCAREHRRKAQREWIAQKRGSPDPKPCAHCGSEFTPQRSTASFCSARCRVAASRRAKA